MNGFALDAFSRQQVIKTTLFEQHFCFQFAGALWIGIGHVVKACQMVLMMLRQVVLHGSRKAKCPIPCVWLWRCCVWFCDIGDCLELVAMISLHQEICVANIGGWQGQVNAFNPVQDGSFFHVHFIDHAIYPVSFVIGLEDGAFARSTMVIMADFAEIYAVTGREGGGDRAGRRAPILQPLI